MLSDKFRWVKILLLSAVLMSLCIHNFFTAPALLVNEVLERIRGTGNYTEPVRFGFARVLQVREDGTARLLVWSEEVEVRQGDAAWKEGDQVSFAGWLTPDGSIDITSFTLHRARWLKKLVSLVAAVIFLGVLSRRAFRWVFRREGTCRT
jgi:hypothetical protein